MREYYSCERCGKRTWRNTSGLFTDREDLCVKCWDEDQVPDGIHHCSDCGSFAQAGSRRCWRCDRLKDMSKRVDELKGQVQEERMEKTVCQSKNISLKDQVYSLSRKVTTLQGLKDQPYNLSIKGWSGTCGEGYLKTVLKAAEIAPHVIVVEYSRRKGA